MKLGIGLIGGAMLVAVGASSPEILWKQLNNGKNTAPQPRLGATGASFGENNFVIFGGCTSSCCYAPMEDTWVYTDSQWKEINTSTNPSPRTYHGSGQLGENLFLFGGINVAVGFMNDSWVFDTSKMQWMELSVSGNNGPSGRAASAVTVINNQAYVYGGRDTQQLFAELWSGEIDQTKGTIVWTAQDKNSLPGPISSAALTSISDDLLVLVGGSAGGHDESGAVFTWSISKKTWSALHEATLSPPRHALAVWPIDSTRVAAFGGENGESIDGMFFGDLFVIDISKGISTRVQNGTSNPSPSQPISRAFTAFSYSSSSFFLFGGFSGYGGGTDDKLFNDFWQLNLS